MMNAPQNTQWGPAMWRFLHGFAELIGTSTIKHPIGDEKRVWLNILNSLRLGLPCPLCRKHLYEHIHKYPFEKTIHTIDNSDSSGLQKFVRLWLFHLHNQATIHTGKPIPDITVEDLTTLYSNYVYERGYVNDIHVIHDHMRRGMFLQWVIRDDIQRFLRASQELIAFYI